jgi:hypothetical protein
MDHDSDRAGIVRYSAVHKGARRCGVFIASFLLARIEVHHRIIEKHHLTAHAVIAERGSHLCKFGRHVNGYGTEIGAGVGYLRLLAATDDQAITSLQWELRTVEKQRRRPLQTQRVRQIARMRELQVHG